MVKIKIKMPQTEEYKDLDLKTDCCGDYLPSYQCIDNIDTVKPVLRGHLWDKETVAFQGR